MRKSFRILDVVNFALSHFSAIKMRKCEMRKCETQKMHKLGLFGNVCMLRKQDSQELGLYIAH